MKPSSETLLAGSHSDFNHPDSCWKATQQYTNNAELRTSSKINPSKCLLGRRVAFLEQLCTRKEYLFRQLSINGSSGNVVITRL